MVSQKELIQLIGPLHGAGKGNSPKTVSMALNSGKGRRYKDWRKLYEQHHGFALRLAFRYLGDFKKAMAAVDSAWVCMLKKNVRGDMPPGSAVFRRYLHQVLVEALVNIVLAELAGDFRGGQRLAEDIADRFALTASSDIWEWPVGKMKRADAERYRDIILLLVGLPTRLRLTFNLRVIDGYSSDEAAALVGIEAETVEIQLAWSRRLLRGQLEKQESIQYQQ